MENNYPNEIYELREKYKNAGEHCEYLQEQIDALTKENLSLMNVIIGYKGTIELASNHIAAMSSNLMNLSKSLGDNE